MGFGIKSIGRAVKKVGKKIGKAVGGTAGKIIGAVEDAGKKIDQEVRRQPGGYLGTFATGGTNIAARGAGRTLNSILAPKIDIAGDEMEDPLVMPDIDEEAVARARRRAAAQAVRGGRASTILTGGSGSLIG